MHLGAGPADEKARLRRRGIARGVAPTGGGSGVRGWADGPPALDEIACRPPLQSEIIMIEKRAPAPATFFQGTSPTLLHPSRTVASVPSSLPSRHALHKPPLKIIAVRRESPLLFSARRPSFLWGLGLCPAPSAASIIPSSPRSLASICLSATRRQSKIFSALDRLLPSPRFPCCALWAQDHPQAGPLQLSITTDIASVDHRVTVALRTASNAGRDLLRPLLFAQPLSTGMPGSWLSHIII